jgi:predicted ATPase
VGFLRSIRPKRSLPDDNYYPWNLPALRTLSTLDLSADVIFFTGENGTGKSTLIEAIAAGTRLQTIGGLDTDRDPTLETARELSNHLTFAWSRRPPRGFFMRSEDFFNFANRINTTGNELEEFASAYDGDDSYGARLARGSLLGQRRQLEGSYGDLHARSHGEAFLRVFQERIRPGGFYLLDEPDTALSPLRQLALLTMIAEVVDNGAQFIIATHSPIITAFPGATIYRFSPEGIAQVAYDDTDNVQLMRDFLSDPQRFLALMRPG